MRLFGSINLTDDDLNPILVKELRQSVRNNMVVAVLILFLGVDLLIAGSALLASQGEQTDERLGRNVFQTLLSILQLTCMLFVPLYAGYRMSAERNGPDNELMFATRLTSDAVVRGKLLSATALTLLIFSVCMPFLFMTYTMRGIDLLTIAFCLLIGFCFCAAANMLGIFAGSFRAGPVARGISSVALGAALLFLYAISIVPELIIAYEGMNWKTLGVWGVAFAIIILMVGLPVVTGLYSFSASLISPYRAAQGYDVLRAADQKRHRPADADATSLIEHATG
jgi:hypothetical protein